MKKPARLCEVMGCVCNQARLFQGKPFCKIMMRLISDIKECPVKNKKEGS